MENMNHLGLLAWKCAMLIQHPRMVRKCKIDINKMLEHVLDKVLKVYNKIALYKKFHLKIATKNIKLKK